MTNHQVTILLVEDDEIDVEMTIHAFRQARIANPIILAINGEVALEMLRGENGHEPVARPFIILLDLNMPRMNGHQFLDQLRSDKELSDAIVFVLTTSDLDQDRWEAYDKHVAGYILKHRVGEGFIKLISMLDHYWRVVELPLERK